MNFSGKASSDKKNLLMDLTPLLDVVFLLLIFFVLTTTFVQNPGIQVDLPKATANPMDSQSESIIIAVAKDGTIIHEGASISFSALKDRMKAYREKRSQAHVVIQADEGAAHGMVVKILDLAQSQGFSKLAIATEEP